MADLTEAEIVEKLRHIDTELKGKMRIAVEGRFTEEGIRMLLNGLKLADLKLVGR